MTLEICYMIAICYHDLLSLKSVTSLDDDLHSVQIIIPKYLTSTQLHALVNVMKASRSHDSLHENLTS